MFAAGRSQFPFLGYCARHRSDANRSWENVPHPTLLSSALEPNPVPTGQCVGLQPTTPGKALRVYTWVELVLTTL